MEYTTPVGRFAPTPSGRMHLGNVFAFLVAWLSVKSRGGNIVLRMEDLDTQRTSGEYAEILRQDLLWLGLTWDEETPPQSLRSDVYETYFARLAEMDLAVKEEQIRAQLHRAFRFVWDSFGDGQEMILLVSALTRMPDALEFIRMHGCEDYLQYADRLMYRSREAQLQQACRDLCL